MLLDMSETTVSETTDSAIESILDIEEFILARNREQSAEFSNSAARLARAQYRARHSTEIAALKCMDGRLNLSVMTEMPPGIIQPYRNIGGKFDLGWPFLGLLFKDWVQYAVNMGRDCLVLTTYHFSKGEHHRGCKGFGYDTEGAKGSAERLRDQFNTVFGRPVVYPIVVGMETDEDALVFHGDNGEVFPVSEHIDMPFPDLLEKFTSLYPDMRPKVRIDLLQLVLGNQRVIRRIRTENRMPIDLDHREQIIGVGRGFDWLHLPNKALIVGPYSQDWASAVATAGSIILSNKKEGRLAEDAGVLLLISALSREGENTSDWKLAQEKVKYLLTHALEALSQATPELLEGNFKVLSGVVNADTRQMRIY